MSDVKKETAETAPASTTAPVSAPATTPESTTPKDPQSGTQPPPKRSGFVDRALSKDNRQTARRFFSAYAQTWVGLSPVWLMGEALTGRKVGTQFNKGRKSLLAAAEEVREAVTTSSRDVVVIIDEKLRGGKEHTGRTAEVIKAAGENAIVVVTTSLEKIQAELHDKNLGPEIKKAVNKNGRDVIIIIDKALKNPVVVTGVAEFARSKGIPHADALLRLGSLALAKILRAMPEEVQEGVQDAVQELDAGELERTSTREEAEEASKIGKAGEGSAPEVKEGGDPYEGMKKRNDCLVM